MQPEPIESSTPILNPSDASRPANASQHGIRPEELRSADERDPREGSISADASPGADARLQELQRLSLNEETGTRPKPSFQRISEYENALSPSPPRKQNEGPAFKVIKNKSEKTDGTQLDAFPNGTICHLRFPVYRI